MTPKNLWPSRTEFSLHARSFGPKAPQDDACTLDSLTQGSSGSEGLLVKRHSPKWEQQAFMLTPDH